MTIYFVPELVTLIIAFIVLIIGEAIVNSFAFLKKSAIPSPVVGGILAAITVSILESSFNIQVNFGTQFRDVLILLFFVSLGFTAKLAALVKGGKPLLYICLITVLLLVLQNLIGIGVALLRGAHPFYGLLAGSISFVGGPGTAMAWAKEASELGLKGAELVAISSATFAVSIGAIVAGPMVSWIVNRHNLRSEKESDAKESIFVEEIKEQKAPKTSTIIRILLLVSIAIWGGMKLNNYATGYNILLPGFLCSLLAGMLITNIADASKKPVPIQVTDRLGDISLQIFLAISLMSLKLSALGAILVPIAIVVILQVMLAFAVAYFILFRALGKNYDAAVTCGGFIGFAISSMPVAMATMDQVSRRYGPAPNAILLITLAGSFFVDLANTIIVKAFVSFLPAI